MNNVLSWDPITKTRRTFHDDSDGNLILDSQADVTDVVDLNKASMAAGGERDSWGDGKVVATIPNVVYWDLVKRGIVDDTARFKRWLNDPDNRLFRRRPGRV